MIQYCKKAESKRTMNRKHKRAQDTVARFSHQNDRCCQSQRHAASRDLARACVCLPAGAVDWRLLRKQKAVLAALVIDTATPGPLRQVFEGILSMLDDVQDRAGAVVGARRVFGRR